MAAAAGDLAPRVMERRSVMLLRGVETGGPYVVRRSEDGAEELVASDVELVAAPNGAIRWRRREDDGGVDQDAPPARPDARALGIDQA